MKLAFLYAGQGSQKVGMGKDIYESNEIFKNTLDYIEEAAGLDFDFKTLMFDGPMEQLSLTRYTQPCMAAFAAGVTEVLKDKGITPDYVAGLSLGEYSALYSAGVFDAVSLVKLVAFRGKAMEEAAAGIRCKMTAVIGLTGSVLTDICSEVVKEDKGYVTVSNYNCRGQYVICGDTGAVEEAELRAGAAGAKRCVALKVSGPFHTKYMKPAGDALEKYFENINFNEMNIPVIFNTTASELKPGESIKDILVKQVQNSIYMENTIELLKNMGTDIIIEIGPGKALSGFVRKTVSGIETYAIEDVSGLNKVMNMNW